MNVFLMRVDVWLQNDGINWLWCTTDVKKLTRDLNENVDGLWLRLNLINLLRSGLRSRFWPLLTTSSPHLTSCLSLNTWLPPTIVVFAGRFRSCSLDNRFWLFLAIGIPALLTTCRRPTRCWIMALIVSGFIALLATCRRPTRCFFSSWFWLLSSGCSVMLLYGWSGYSFGCLLVCCCN